MRAVSAETAVPTRMPATHTAPRGRAGAIGPASDGPGCDGQAIARGGRRAYLRAMSRLARMLVLVLLAAFAAGTAAHAGMALGMAATPAEARSGDAAHDAGAPVCPDCAPGEEGLVACDLACASPFLAAAGPEAPPVAALGRGHEGAPHALAVGLRSPPDPFPPRTPILH